jgi:signal transduction histidine kinase
MPREVVYEAVGASAIVATLVGIHRYRPSPSLPWWLIAGGMFAWFLGDVFWSWYPYLTGRVLSTPSIADALYFLAYPLLISAMALIVRTRRAGLHAGGWIDAAIVGVVAAMLIWEFAVEEYVAGGITLSAIVELGYPVMDAVMIGLLARLLFAPGPRTPAFAFIVTSVGLVLTADIAYAHVVATDQWGIYESLSALWMLGNAMIGAAALHPSMLTIAGATDGKERALSRRRAVVLVIVASLPILQLLLTSLLGQEDSVADTAIGMLLVLGMVFYRLSSLIGSSERQAVELASLHRDRGLVLDEITRAIEEERTRLSADLHDGPIQRVTGLGMRAYVGVRKLRAGDQGAAVDILEQIADGLNQEVRGLRSLMSQLRPPVLSERGLVDALRDQADRISSERGIVTLVDGAVEGRLSPEVETGLYRIAQEALTNACRHSLAERIVVRVETTDHRVRLSVRDDGVGIDPAASPTPGQHHFGLLAMRERAAMLHGSLTIASVPGGGTIVAAEVPRSEAS